MCCYSVALTGFYFNANTGHLETAHARGVLMPCTLEECTTHKISHKMIVSQV